MSLLSMSAAKTAIGHHHPFWRHQGTSPALTNMQRLQQKRGGRTPNPKPKSFLERLGCILTFISKFAVIGGIIGGGVSIYFQYHTSQEVMKVQNALQFAAIHNSDKFLESRRNLYAVWHGVDMDTYKGVTQEVMSSMKNAAVGNKDIKDDILMVTNLYNVIIKCVKMDKCDDEVIDGVFTEEIVGFYCANVESLKAIEKESNDPGYTSPIKEHILQFSRKKKLTISGYCESITDKTPKPANSVNATLMPRAVMPGSLAANKPPPNGTAHNPR